MSSDLPQRKSHRLDPRVYKATNCEFSFTICARQHGAPFLNPPFAEQVVDSLLWTRARYSWALFCYCLMPDHLHFVCRLTDRESTAMNGGARGRIDVGVLEHVARFKSYTTRLAWNYGLSGELWQHSSFDRVIDLQRPFDEVVEYVLRNPVRRELARAWEEWPYARIVDRW